MTAIRKLLGGPIVALFLRPLRAIVARLALPSLLHGVRLDGETPDGRAIHIDLLRAELYHGIALGGEPGESGRVIVAGRAAAHPVTLRLKGRALYVRCEGSGKAASLNARRLQAYRHERVSHGDWLCLEGSVLRLTFY
ncbi:hypothetical protein SAMN05216588_106213 [Pseudomonas flavescens]|uniref:FHA domain-containing protein n=1 Tax=Phytopseudomonas flavescens TaxID=29435 RepID=A0A1G8EGE8_9GAMM|nr:hypothetical protein [Pseudomonas flavescens]SDH68985.1 hypothetical protein SAMN05216588_106213 [Pseudomonas flavescens]